MNAEFIHVVKTFHNTPFIKDISFKIYDGDAIAIIGPSGSGKSTLLRLLNGLDTPTSGQILVNGHDINKHNYAQKLRTKMGIVFQSPNLFEHLTAIENVMLALQDIKKMSKQKAYDIAMEQLENVHLADKALKYANELSMGEQKRVCIARALALNPEMILLDEPAEGLDPQMIHEIQLVIERLKKLNKTIVLVTHKISLAKAISDRIFYIDQGELYEQGLTQDIFNHPVRERTKAFVKQLRIFKYKALKKDFDLQNFFREFNYYLQSNGISPIVSTKADAYLSVVINMMKMLEDEKQFFIMVQYDEREKKLTVVWYVYIDTLHQTEFIEAFKAITSPDFGKNITSIQDDDYNLKVSITLEY